jgi:hypothetical protein
MREIVTRTRHLAHRSEALRSSLNSISLTEAHSQNSLLHNIQLKEEQQ